mmetsp:Transcript_2808/g.8500  ORF Transcript_2808/g.8500 Transcript_2808/m.8500 type:complete len:206 (-) Transcript_2808:421-1038(-)
MIHVVRHVRGADPVMQKVKDGAVRAVDGHEGALDVGPVLLLEVGDVGVCVLQPRVEHQPNIGESQRQGVAERHLRRARHRRPLPERRAHGHDPHVAQPHLLLPHISLKERVAEGLGGDEVVGGAAAGSPRGAEQQVRGPAEQENNHAVEQRPGALANRSLDLEAEVALVGARDRRHVCLALGQVVGARVVHRVRALPREVWHQQR